MFSVPEKYRARVKGNSPFNTTAEDGNNGIFVVPMHRGKKGKTKQIRIIASDELGWEHVSVSYDKRTPTWDEMCRVKDLFWSPEDLVIQYHPPEKNYVNNHKHCLHLWRPNAGQQVPVPDDILVGIKELGIL